MILHRYFAQKFFFTLLMVFGAFLILFLLIDLIEHLRRFKDKNLAFTEILGLVALNAPAGLYEILPLVMILSSILMFRTLARTSELVVVRATGRSVWRALIAPLSVTLLIGLLVVAIGNPIVAVSQRIYEDQQTRLTSDGQAPSLSISNEGLWMRQGNSEGQIVIRAIRADSDASHFFGTTFLRMDNNSRPIERIHASEAELLPGEWHLRDIRRWPLDETILNPATAVSEEEQMIIPTELTSARLIEGFGGPEEIPFWSLPGYISQLELSGLSIRRHQLWFQMELARPIFFAALVMVGAVFSLRNARAGRSGLLILGAILSGFFLYYIRSFAQILGENGQISIVMAAWAPPIAAFLLALGALLMLEDG